MNKGKQKELVLRLIHFRSGENDYAISLNFVKEVIRGVAIKKVPELPSFVSGVMNLRGQIVPVVDFMTRAGLGHSEMRLQTRIMILRIKAFLIGVMVDEVREVLLKTEKDISRNLHADVVLDPKYIGGTFVHDGKVILWVNAQKLFTANEFIQMDQRQSHA